MILEELWDTRVETRVEKLTLRFFMKRCTGLYGKWIKCTFFRSRMEQNIEFLVPGSAKYRISRSNILRHNIEASGAESVWA